MSDNAVKPEADQKKPDRRIQKLLWVLVRIVFFTITGFLIIFYFFQSRFVFFPSRQIDATPDDIGLPFEPVEIQTSDGVKITGWFVPARNAGGTILFFHGNGGNISHRLDSLHIFNELGLATLIIDYRGYGRSEGKVGENGIYLDAEAAWKYLVEQRGTDPDKIILFGRSLGGAVAVNLAGKHKPKALIVESTFTSIPEIGSDAYPFLPCALLRLLSRYKFNAREDISQVNCPVLVVHSRDDNMIPFAHGQAIFDAAAEPKEFLEITGSHNNGFVTSGQTYKEGMDKFISERCRGRGVGDHDKPSVPGQTWPQTPRPRHPRDYKVVHVFVALCDNRHQGIVPVPVSLGNGQDPRNNLYWGAMYGVKTFFARSPHWKRLTGFTKPTADAILDRCVFRSRGPAKAVYVVADAYDGARMKTALSDFFSAAGGLNVTEVALSGGQVRLQAGGYSDMVCFVGHNGLMDVRLPEFPENQGVPNPACAVVLACKSHSYFVAPLRKAQCRPLITTSGLMAPEAYTLDAIIRSWSAGENPSATRQKAADAYAKYQRCSRRAAMQLFVNDR